MPDTNICAVCGDPFQAQRKTKRYCTTRCRTRASRAGMSVNKPGREVVTALPTPSPSPAPPRPADPATKGTTYSVTVDKLEAVDRLGTPLGQAALVVAERIDNSYRETGSALAALVRSLDQALERATAGAKHDGSSLDNAKDELARRRSRSRRGA